MNKDTGGRDPPSRADQHHTPQTTHNYKSNQYLHGGI